MGSGQASLAASLLASADVELFLEAIHRYIQTDPKAFGEKRERFEEAIERIDSDFSTNDSYCSVDYPSWEIEEQVSYYHDLQQSYGKLLKHYRYLQTATYINRTITDVKQSILAKFDPEKFYDNEVLAAIQEMGGEIIRSFDQNQLEIDFSKPEN